MKATFRGLLVATGMVLASAYDASAALYLQASSGESQLATDTKGHSISMNSTDASLGISQKNGVVDIAASGNYFIVAAIQVGGNPTATGKVRLWLRVNGKDVDNSNCKQSVAAPGFITVMGSHGVNALKHG